MTTLLLPGSLIDSQWLADNIDHPKLVMLDARSYMPGDTPGRYELASRMTSDGWSMLSASHWISTTAAGSKSVVTISLMLLM